MATNEEILKVRNEVQQNLATVLETRAKEWAVRTNLGEINFADTIPHIEKVTGLFRMIKDVSLDYVGLNQLNQLNETLKDIIEQFKKIESFTLKVTDPPRQRDQIANTIRDKYEQWFSAVFHILAFAIRSTTDFAALERDLREKIAGIEVLGTELGKRHEKVLVDQRAILAQSEEVLASIKTAAAQAGVSKEAIHFKKEADEQNSSSSRWKWATILLGIATVAWGVVVLFVLKIPTDATTPQIVQQVLGKLFVLAGLYYGLVWSARNFKAARHNFIVNRHRQNALNTFEAFEGAASRLWCSHCRSALQPRPAPSFEFTVPF